MFFKQITHSLFIVLTLSMGGAFAMSSSSALSTSGSTSSTTTASTAAARMRATAEVTIVSDYGYDCATHTLDGTNVDKYIDEDDFSESAEMRDLHECLYRDEIEQRLRQKLISCTTEANPNRFTAKKQKSELSDKQLNMLFELVGKFAQFDLLGSTALIEALKRIDKGCWHLARLIILDAILRFAFSPTEDGWIVQTMIPTTALTSNYISMAFDTTHITEEVLYEAIEKEQWPTLRNLLENEFLLSNITASTANGLLSIAALIPRQSWLIHRIVNSPILGPKITYETCDLIIKTDNKDAISELRQSPYFETIMRQKPIPVATSTAVQDIVDREDKLSIDSDREVQAIMENEKPACPEDPRTSLMIQQQAFQKTHDCTEWLAWKERAPHKHQRILRLTTFGRL